MRDTTFTAAPVLLLIAGIYIVGTQTFFGCLCLAAGLALLVYLPGEKE